MASTDAAHRAGLAYARRRHQRTNLADPYAAELDWPAWRRAILAYGGIGPSQDWDREDIPGDLYREHGKPPDLVAAEAVRNAPWGSSGDDDAMIRHLKAAHAEYERHPERAHTIALPAAQLERRRSLRASREAEARQSYGSPRYAKEQAAHSERVNAFVRQAIAARRAAGPRPAVGFYTDRRDVVHPITASRRAGQAYARHARGRSPRT